MLKPLVLASFVFLLLFELLALGHNFCDEVVLFLDLFLEVTDPFLLELVVPFHLLSLLAGGVQLQLEVLGVGH